MAEANPQFGLRPMLPTDVDVLAEVYRASIGGLTDEDYSVEQQEAWIANADDAEAFGKRLTGQLTLVATLGQGPIAFASLAGDRKIDMLFVHPAVARQGAATKLIDALETLAAGRGTVRLTTDASDTARPFFDRRGYVADQRNTVMLGDEWLSNTTMHKDLKPRSKVVSLSERSES